MGPTPIETDTRMKVLELSYEGEIPQGVFVLTRNGRHLDLKVRKRTFALFILSHLLIYFQLHNFKVAMSGRLVAWLSLNPSWRALPSPNLQG